MLFTAEFDDLYFLKINDGTISNAWQNAANYGNGRILGNFICFAIIKSQFLQALIKAVAFTALPILSLKLLNIKSKKMVLISSLLLLFTAPVLLAQILQWTAGFVNYVIPVDFLLLSILILKNIDTKNIPFKIIGFLAVILLGLAETLFSENTTLFCLIVGVLIIVLSFVKKRKNKLSAIAFFIANCAGTLVLIKKPFVTGKAVSFNMQYRSTVFDNLLSVDTAKTIITNLMIFEKTMAQCVILFAVMSAVLIIALKKSNIKNKSFFKLTFILYPLLSAINLFAFYSPMANIYLRSLLTAIKLVILALYIVFALLLVINSALNKADKNTLIALIILAAVSAAPLMIVSPIEARCFYLTSVILALFTLKYMWCIKEGIKEILVAHHINEITMTVLKSSIVVLMVILVAIYADTRYISQARDSYVKEQMKTGATEIEIPKLPFEYFVVSNGTSGPFESYYSYSDGEKIKFVECSTEDWLKKYKYTNGGKEKLFNVFYYFIDNQ